MYLEACNTWTWRPIVNLPSNMVITSNKLHIWFNKCISNSLNKKFKFLPVQSVPGGLQHLNLEADFKFFCKYDDNIHKDAYLVK